MVYLGILIQLNLLLTAITLIVIPLFLLIAYVTSKKVFILTKELQHYRDKLIEFLNSHVRNKLLIDLYNLKQQEQQEFSEVAIQVKNVNIKTNTILSFLNNLSSLIAITTPLLTLFIGSILVIHNELSLGSLIAFNSYTALLFSTFSKLLTIPPIYTQMKASIDRIEQAKFSELIYHKGNYLNQPLPDTQLIVVKDFVPFIENSPLLISEVNFVIRKGDLLQVTGKNGCGKSILLKCLINYHENFSGNIQVKPKLNITYIPQEHFLLEGTIQENLLKGLKIYDRHYMHFLIELFKFELPLNQEVTPFSLTLSSGQLQKIKLIRALLIKPDVLLLDEVFANLDHETTITLINYLKEINLTTIFVYHGDMTFLLSQTNYQVLDLAKYSNL